MSFPAVVAALTDPRLQRRDLYVYHLALSELDLQEWRHFKRAYVARRCTMLGSHVSRAMKRLCAAGYLERDNADWTGPRRYRLRYSPTPLPVEVPKSAPPHAA